MRVHNFFIKEKIGEQREIAVSDSALLDQWRHVLRLNTGSMVRLFDNSGFEYLAQFRELSYLKAVFLIIEKKKNQFAPKRKVILFQSLLKKDKLEFVVEKCAELGVSGFAPIISERSEKKSFNLGRAEKIAREASEQSGRGVLPTIAPPRALEEALAGALTSAIIFDPSGVRLDTQDLTDKEIAVSCFIGPEGGWSDRELALFRQKNLPIISLGAQTLRSETAAIAVATLLLLSE